MNKNVLNYKGYSAKVEFNSEDSILFGKIEGINHLVTFESENAADIEEEFRHAVDDYLSFCAANNIKPDKEYKGVFNVRVSPELHRQLSNIAVKHNKSLNEVVCEALIEFVDSLNHTHSYVSIYNEQTPNDCGMFYNSWCSNQTPVIHLNRVPV